MRKIVKIFFVILFIFGLFVVKEKIDINNIFNNKYNSNYIYVVNRQSESEIIKKNYKSKAYPASLTKIMTTLVALDHINDLSAIAPVDIDTYREMVNKNSSMAGFYGNEQTTYRDLLYGTILSSGGEAANSLAINIAGSVEDFVKLMNDKAQELGLEDTHFVNPEGLHNKKQYTTAYDMAILLDYTLDNGHFRAIFTKEAFKTTSTLDHPNGIVLQSTVLSKLHDMPQNGFKIIGGKSGTTYEAGQCWATLAIKGDTEYIAIVMGAKLEDINDTSNKHIEDTIKIYEGL
ncbi:D-alanyl-D-alanine carboxypeptidase (penicillin-binding protein 5/6) [Alkalibaculum bacchi]|uniref:D-alanyl-D-alanine carboxypeptidase (Penicillin-binding protein 5/6) n=1 Tax=Alkalibaculum bacchi TaxID=645887 RepID=A0A366I060_9FIRM|nr:serine hydrolase [Alkalibaculum bacchi]RBP60345.1 D-alanyl-D-alanine carboxypeptidase (penicillin-binding protein 5/6) [Alkalibaculum bacchi]